MKRYQKGLFLLMFSLTCFSVTSAMEPPAVDEGSVVLPSPQSAAVGFEVEVGRLGAQPVIQEQQSAASANHAELRGLRSALQNSEDEIARLKAQLSKQEEQTARKRLEAVESAERSKRSEQEIERLQQAMIRLNMEKKQEPKLFKVTMPEFHLYPELGLSNGDKSLGELSRGDIMQTTLDDEVARCGQKFWHKVRVLSGEAIGKVGWVNTTDACKDPKKAAKKKG